MSKLALVKDGGSRDQNESANSLASVCKAAADPIRAHVLALLHENSFSVGELVDILGIKQSALSHHLKILARAELVSTRREGNSIFYRQRAATGKKALDALRSAILSEAANIVLSPDLAARLERTYGERAQSSVAFFNANADKFRNEKDLIADHYHYGEAVEQILKDTVFERRENALEIGPGDGAFLEKLSALFSQITALDNSTDMLNKAQQRSRAANLTNIRFVHGTTTKHDGLGLYDAIVINMVLHHVPAPAQVFRDAAKLLAHKGVLTITELCRHEQTWAHTACGDLWLGFEADELSLWARSAGLIERTQTTLAQRNGFQIQIRQFQRV